MKPLTILSLGIATLLAAFSVTTYSELVETQNKLKDIESKFHQIKKSITARVETAEKAQDNAVPNINSDALLEKKIADFIKDAKEDLMKQIAMYSKTQTNDKSDSTETTESETDNTEEPKEGDTPTVSNPVNKPKPEIKTVSVMEGASQVNDVNQKLYLLNMGKDAFRTNEEYAKSVSSTLNKTLQLKGDKAKRLEFSVNQLIYQLSQMQRSENELEEWRKEKQKGFDDQYKTDSWVQFREPYQKFHAEYLRKKEPLNNHRENLYNAAQKQIQLLLSSDNTEHKVIMSHLTNIVKQISNK